MRLEDYQPTPPAEVACESDGTTSTLVFHREFRHPPERVWAALTQADQIPKWAPYGVDRNLDSEGPVLLTMHDGSEPAQHEIVVSKVIPGQLLEHGWVESTLSWKIAATDNGTRLTLRNTLAKPEWVTMAAAGWHMCFDFAELLMHGIEFGPIVPIVGQAAMDHGWPKLAQHYAKVLGLPDPTGQEEGETAGDQ